MAGEHILVVEDDSEISEVIYQYLDRDGFKVSSTNNAKDALDLLHEVKPDLIILDILLPDMDGIELCKELRKTTAVPIIFISCKTDEIDKILALGVGGDDYLTKPFSPRELVARVKAHLRRNVLPLVPPQENKSLSLKYADLEMDPSTHTVIVDQRAINLSAKEFELLHHLALNPNRVYNNDQLFNLIWGTDSMGDTRTVMVHISNIRKKIEKDPSSPKFVSTIRGVGYKFIG
jgi:DNA-binding response OmpR family regulator